jgi:hypothetical protein
MQQPVFARQKQTADSTAIESGGREKDPSLLPTAMKRPLSQQPDPTFRFLRTSVAVHPCRCAAGVKIADAALVVRDAVTYGKANAIDLVRPKHISPCRAQRATGRGEAVCLFVCHRNAPRLSR